MKNFKIGLFLVSVALFWLVCDNRVPTGAETDGYKLSIASDVSYIWADNGKTTATLTATLKDKDDFPITGKTISFAATSGSIGGSAVTNSSGQAITTFDH